MRGFERYNHKFLIHDRSKAREAFKMRQFIKDIRHPRQATRRRREERSASRQPQQVEPSRPPRRPPQQAGPSQQPPRYSQAVPRRDRPLPPLPEREERGSLFSVQSESTVMPRYSQLDSPRPPLFDYLRREASVQAGPNPIPQEQLPPLGLMLDQIDRPQQAGPSRRPPPRPPRPPAAQSLMDVIEQGVPTGQTQAGPSQSRFSDSTIGSLSLSEFPMPPTGQTQAGPSQSRFSDSTIGSLSLSEFPMPPTGQTQAGPSQQARSDSPTLGAWQQAGPSRSSRSSRSSRHNNRSRR